MSTSDLTRQLVIFSLGSEEYALPITRVQEIIRYTEPRSVASQTAWIRGVINLRGKIMPVCDLALRLGLPTERVDTAKIVIVETGSGTGRRDRRRRRGGADRHGRAARGRAVADSDYVEAIAKVDDRLAILLNPDGLFAGVEIAA